MRDVIHIIKEIYIRKFLEKKNTDNCLIYIKATARDIIYFEIY